MQIIFTNNYLSTFTPAHNYGTLESMKAVIYARVSTTDKGQDTENQMLQLREYAARCKYELTHEYVDHASAKTGDREQFKAMLSDATKRKFDIVLVWALDRFSREGVAETFIHIKRLTEHNVKFESFTEAHFRTTGPAGELMIAMAAWFAQQERVRISERTIAGLQRAKAQGKVLGRRKTVFDRQEVLDLHAEGKSVRYIAGAIGISPSSVQRVLAA